MLPRILAFFFISLAVMPACALAQQSVATDAERGARVAWLKEHAIALKSIDPADEDFSDLEPLRKVIGEARIVQLGEQQHQDGATLVAKARLIKFLHQKMGFDVLALEQGLYDSRKAWELLREGRDPFEAVRQGVLGVSGREQFQPVINYLGQNARGDRPLELCGFDCQFTARGANGRIVEDVKSLLGQLTDGALDDNAKEVIIEAINSLAKFEAVPDLTVRQRYREALEKFAKALSAQHSTPALPASELGYWRQIANCIAVEIKRQWRPEGNDNDQTPFAGENLRDAQMAKNLVWLAREVYPQRKIIAWAASSHLIRNPSMVQRVVPRDAANYHRWRPMGDGVWAELNKETYTLAFLCAEGELSWGKVPAPAPGSLEDLFQATGYRSAIVDFRNLKESGQWLKQPLVARPMGYANYAGDWTKAFDGFVFIRTQYSSTQAQRLRPAAAAGRERLTIGWTGPKNGVGPFEIGFDTAIKHGGQRSLYLKGLRPTESGTTLIQACAADDYRGKRLRMSAYLKTQDVTGRAALGMRIHGEEMVDLASDNMSNRPIRGTSDWKKYEVVLDVPMDAVELSFGVQFRGEGQVWIDDFQFETVGDEVLTTGAPMTPIKRPFEVLKNLPRVPINLDFER